MNICKPINDDQLPTVTKLSLSSTVKMDSNFPNNNSQETTIKSPQLLEKVIIHTPDHVMINTPNITQTPIFTPTNAIIKSPQRFRTSLPSTPKRILTSIEKSPKHSSFT